MTDPVAPAPPERVPRFSVTVAIAFAAMCVQDLLATCMVVFEAHYRGEIAGLFDAAYWVAGLASTGQAILIINRDGWRHRRSLTIIAAVSLANYVGTVAGVALARGLS